jgi:hypothetical protein
VPSLSECSRKPPIPPVTHTEDTVFPVVVAVLPSRVAQDGGEEPEESRGPCRDGDADGHEGRKEVDDDQHSGDGVGG